MIHKKKDCVASDMIISDCCGLGCANCGVCKCEDKPIPGKQYSLTGGKNDKCIMNGNSWSESLVDNK